MAVDWGFYQHQFASVEEAQPVLHEAAKALGENVYAVQLGVVVDGNNLVFVSEDLDPPSKIVIAVTSEQLASGAWHREFSVRALDAALAVFVSRSGVTK
jgi:hypothetical protein